MNDTNPPAAPSDLPPPRPPIEVQAEPVQPGERGRVFEAAPPSAGGGGGGSAGGAGAPAAAPAASNSGWAAFCHLVGLIDFGLSFLFLGLIATLVLWLIRKDTDPEADFHGKEALNFQLNVLFWQFAAIPLIACCLIGIPMLIVLPLVKVVMLLVGAIHAANGERWRYPFVFRVVR